MTIRIIAFFLILILIDIYGYYALREKRAEWRSGIANAFRTVYWSGLILLLILILNSILGHILPSGVAIYLRAFIFISYFSRLLMVIPFLLEDLYRLFKLVWTKVQKTETTYDPSRSRFIRNAAIGVAAIPFTSLSYGLLGNQYRFRSIKQDVVIKDLHPDLENLKIIQISDIHAGTFVFKNPLYNAIEIINKANPDIVVFTGDLVNDKADEVERFIDVFAGIKSKYGVYSILGNHDYGDYYQWENPQDKEENMLQMYSYHREMGWDLLRDEHRKIKVGGAVLGMIGVENFSAFRNFPKKGNLEKAIDGMGAVDFQLLLSHDPSHWDYEVNKKYKDIHLMLAGHTHGFQYGIEIPGYFRWSPSQYAYTQWAGLYSKGNQYIYVNRGLGCLAYPGRVGILPEISEITLKST